MSKIIFAYFLANENFEDILGGPIRESGSSSCSTFEVYGREAGFMIMNYTVVVFYTF